ncbi:MAG: FliH/SctL family protein, partial [bacterium]
AILDGVKSFSILEDQNIEPGGCVIETNLGFIDSKISTKLKSIEEALAKESDTIQQESSSKVPPLPPKKEIANEPADLKADLANDLDDGFDDELEDELDDDLEDDLDDDLDDRLDDNPKDELKEKKPLADDDFGDDLQLDDFDKDF